MTVCVDTNVLLQARATSHPYGVILDAFIFGSMRWAVSPSVMEEYREIILQKCGTAAWRAMDALFEVLERRSIVVIVNPHFQFQVIANDPDDNKFTDCAITTGADYVITSDRDFASLANAGYKPQPITPEAFIERYRGVYV
ncbi:MAG: putative toxin-antitoxin system toxin component, PIN family [Prosthecobacter sp.]|uniref:putative toxin-antitoxin system toxin component, PIN family n=1 Tax=Prosthecobacter sp. TaxID=1965333 RepID=UPI0039040EFA